MNIYKVTNKDIEQELANLKQITFEVTTECNLKCNYCCYGDFYEGYDSRDSLSLSFDKVKLLLDALFLKWRRSIKKASIHKLYISFYGGEPLLNIDLIRKTVAYIEAVDKPTNMQFVYSMTTNGVLLNKYQDYLVEKQFELLVSLDGNAQGNSYRVDHSGNNSFDRVYANLKKLQKKYPDYFDKYIKFNSVLHNKNSVIETSHFIKLEFGKTSNISQLSDDSVKPEKYTDFIEMFQNYTRSIVDDKSGLQPMESLVKADVEELREFIESQTRNYYKDYNYLFQDISKLPILQTGTCIPFSKKIFVTVNGKILPCERIEHKYALGYIDEDVVHLDEEKIAEKINLLYRSIQQICKTCYNLRKCSQCMYKIRNLSGETPFCKSYTDKNGFSTYVDRNISFLRKNPEYYAKICNQEI